MTGGSTQRAGLATAAHEAFEQLHQQAGFPTLLFTRDGAQGRTVIAAIDDHYGIVPGESFPTSLADHPRLSSAVTIIVHVQLPDGSPFGSIVAVRGSASESASGDYGLRLLATMLGALAASQLALGESQRLHEHHDAARDHLTGLVTRQSWEAQVAIESGRCADVGEHGCVLVVEIDDIRHTNEINGHEAGDVQLRTAALLMADIVPNEYLVARTTGDRFGVLAVGATRQTMDELAGTIRQRASTAAIAMSTGVGGYRADGGFLAAISEADGAIEVANASLATTCADVDPNDIALLEALDSGAIHGYFQPIVDLRTGEVVTIEALARWQRDDGVREPATFLPQLHKAGLMAKLFDRILDHGLGQLAEFRSISPTLRLAVNFEFDSIPEVGLHALVVELTERHGLTPDVLSLELSERQSFDLAPALRQDLLAVAEAGTRLVLDDFGTGFASLETLTSLPISGVKLDRRFTSQVVNGDREPAVVKAMISLATEAGLEVIAEGIETQAQCDRLVRLGCRLGQGYLFALPQPSDALATVLSAPLVSTW